MSAPYIVVKLTEKGLDKVLNGKVGMTFIVEGFGGLDGTVAHVRDYRYNGIFNHYITWSLSKDDYEIIK